MLLVLRLAISFGSSPACVGYKGLCSEACYSNKPKSDGTVRQSGCLGEKSAHQYGSDGLKNDLRQICAGQRHALAPWHDHQLLFFLDAVFRGIHLQQQRPKSICPHFPSVRN